MERNFKSGRVHLEPFNTTNQRFYIWFGNNIAGMLDMGNNDKSLYPDGPVVEFHWRAIQAMTANDLESLKAGIKWLRRRL